MQTSHIFLLNLYPCRCHHDHLNSAIKPLRPFHSCDNRARCRYCVKQSKCTGDVLTWHMITSLASQKGQLWNLINCSVFAPTIENRGEGCVCIYIYRIVKNTAGNMQNVYRGIIWNFKRKNKTKNKNSHFVEIVVTKN